MCRLFAVLAAKPVKVDVAFRVLAEQSKEHKDGWGVAQLDGRSPQIERGLEPAGQSLRFAQLGDTVSSKALLAHLRLASMGPVTLENTHPFINQGWAFMHNGTVKNFAAHQQELEALLPEQLRAGIGGQTESERCFALFLASLRLNGLDDAARALAGTLRTVIDRCDRDVDVPASLNFLACDGRRIVATRHGRTLWLHQGEGVRVVASEKLWAEGDWQELAEDEVIGIDADLSVKRWRLSELA